MKNLLSLFVGIILLFFACKPQEQNIQISEMSPGPGYTAVVGEIVSFTKPVLMIRIEESVQGGASAPKLFPKDTEFHVSAGYERFHQQRFDEPVESYLQKGKRIGFTCNMNQDLKKLTISQIFKP